MLSTKLVSAILLLSLASAVRAPVLADEADAKVDKTPVASSDELDKTPVAAADGADKISEAGSDVVDKTPAAGADVMGKTIVEGADVVNNTEGADVVKKASTKKEVQAEDVTAPAVISLGMRCLAEMLGVGVIVSLGCGAVCADKYLGAGTGLGHVAWVFGLAVALAIYATADTSGAHLNPAVTIALAVYKGFPSYEVLPYIGAQILGAFLAAAVNFAIMSGAIVAHEEDQKISRGEEGSEASFAGAFAMVPNAKYVSTAGATAVEAWLTGVLVFIIFAATDSAQKTMPAGEAPVWIGAAVACLVTVGGPLTCCGMNPARDLGPRLVVGIAGWGQASLTGAAVYTLGPIAGALLGGGAYQYLIVK